MYHAEDNQEHLPASISITEGVEKLLSPAEIKEIYHSIRQAEKIDHSLDGTSLYYSNDGKRVLFTSAEEEIKGSVLLTSEENEQYRNGEDPLIKDFDMS